MRQLLTHPTQVAVDLFDGFDLELAKNTLERTVIEAYLIETEGSIAHTARLLHLHHTTLVGKMLKHGLMGKRRSKREVPNLTNPNVV